MTGNTLADKCDLSRHAIIDYENGNTGSGLDTLKQIADMLGINPDKLYDEYYQFLNYPYSIKKRAAQANAAYAAGVWRKFSVNRKTVERWEKRDITITRKRFKEMKEKLWI